MTKEQYTLNVIELRTKHRKEIENLHIEFATLNNPYSVNDVVKDQNGYTKIASMDVGFAYGSNIPIMIYNGIACKKNGVGFKRLTLREVYQSNII